MEPFTLADHIMACIRDNPECADVLLRIVQYENARMDGNDTEDRAFPKYAWEPAQIGIAGGHLRKLNHRGIIVQVYKSNKYRLYVLADFEETKTNIDYWSS